MISLAPVTLTGNPQTVSLTKQFPGGRTKDPVRLANESPYALQVTVAGDIHWLNPWTADVFVPTEPISAIPITPTILTSRLPTSPSSLLLITCAEQGEQIPGTYPMALPRQTANYAPQQILDTAITGAGGAQVTHTGVQVPVGAHGLLVVTADPVSLNGAGQVSIVGETTLLDYIAQDGAFPSAMPGSGLLFYSALAPDTTLKVIYKSGTNQQNWWLIALLDPEAVTIVNQVNAFLASQATGAPLYTASEAGTAPSLGVTMSQSNPAPWQAPQKIPVDISNAFAAGGVTNPVAGVAGKTIYLHRLLYTIDTPSAVGNVLRLFDGNPATTGVQRGTWGQNLAGPFALDFGGVPLTAGNGLYLKSDAVVTLRGSVVVSGPV